jgi:hypothetical protein
MNRIFPYIIIFILLLIFISILTRINKEYYDSIENRPPGPWGKIGTGKPWYDYPYILHNIEYY